MNIEEVLEERDKRYGGFKSQAELSQTLKSVIILSKNHPIMPNYQREALSMILHKIARICNGDYMYIESWRDLAGYAQLVVSQLNNSENSVDAKITYVKKVGDKWVDIPK